MNRGKETLVSMGKQILVRGTECGEISAKGIGSIYFHDVFPNSLAV